MICVYKEIECIDEVKDKTGKSLTRVLWVLIFFGVSIPEIMVQACRY